MNYAKATRIIRAASGLSQSELAEKIGRAPSLLSRIESGERKPGQNLIEEICNTLDVPTPLFMLLASDSDSTVSKSLSGIGGSLLAVLQDMKSDGTNTLNT